MSEFLYKVAEPRTDWTFEPRPFWRSEDWSSSTHKERTGLMQDCVLYAGEFDEVNIHLLPKVWRARVWLDDETRSARLKALGFSWAVGSRAVIFALESDRESIESFAPTIFAFERAGFERTPSNEFVSRESRTAIAVEIVSFQEAVRRWQFAMTYVVDGESLAEAFRSGGIDHQIQT